MALGGCGQICKWIIILFNMILILLGLAVFGAAVYLRISAQAPVNLLTNHFIFVVGLSIAVSVVIIIAAVFGDYGSSNENKSALGIYSSLLTLLAMAATVGGIVAYVYNKEFSNHVAEFYATVYAQYLVKGDVIRAFLLKLYHNAFDCCGLGGTMQTLMGVTNICPQETNFLGISVSTSSSCLPIITANLQASTVLGIFLGFAGVLLLPIVCSSFIWQQLSRPLLISPPYAPLSPCTTTTIQLAPSSTFSNDPYPSPPSYSKSLCSPPSYPSVANEI